MTIINTLKDLLSNLDSSTKDEYAAIGANLDIPLSELEKFMFWNKDHYARNCIVRTDHYELILLCWEKGQETPIHCHGGEECWVYVMDGKLKEGHFHLEDGQPVLESTEVMSTGEKSFMCDELGYHKLHNVSDGRSMSLHLYMDPIDQCTKFDKSNNIFKAVDLTYYSYEGELEAVGV